MGWGGYTQLVRALQTTNRTNNQPPDYSASQDFFVGPIGLFEIWRSAIVFYVADRCTSLLKNRVPHKLQYIWEDYNKIELTTDNAVLHYSDDHKNSNSPFSGFLSAIGWRRRGRALIGRFVGPGELYFTTPHHNELEHNTSSTTHTTRMPQSVIIWRGEAVCNVLCL